jgi:hypothetical protein
MIVLYNSHVKQWILVLTFTHIQNMLGKIQQTNKLTANDNDVNNPQGKMIFSVV